MHKALLCLFLALFSGGSARATSMIPLTLSDLEAASQAIVVATPIAVRSLWQDKKIVTVYTLEVGEVVKQDASPAWVAPDREAATAATATASPCATLEVVLLGGSVTEPYPLVMTVPGVPHLTLKRKALLFLSGQPGRRPTLTGWTQGYYPVERDGDGVERVEVASFVFEGRAKTGAAVSGRLSLADFVAEIRRVAEERKAATR